MCQTTNELSIKSLIDAIYAAGPSPEECLKKLKSILMVIKTLCTPNVSIGSSPVDHTPSGEEFHQMLQTERKANTSSTDDFVNVMDEIINNPPSSLLSIIIAKQNKEGLVDIISGVIQFFDDLKKMVELEMHVSKDFLDNEHREQLQNLIGNVKLYTPTLNKQPQIVDEKELFTRLYKKLCGIDLNK